MANGRRLRGSAIEEWLGLKDDVDMGTEQQSGENILGFLIAEASKSSDDGLTNDIWQRFYDS